MAIGVKALDCRSQFLMPWHVRFLALDGGEVIGHVGAECKGDDFPYLTDLFVVEGRRREGLGTWLLDAAAEWAEEHNFVGLTAGVARMNFASRKCFESNGYRHVFTYDHGVMLFSKPFRQVD